MWHQNRYADPDPKEGGLPFYRRTPFISTTAGTVERHDLWRKNRVYLPRWQALRFATDGWRRDGYLFYCYVLTIGKQAVAHEAFAEELRELNVYTGYSPYHPEGEITAKIRIPPTQIEYVEFWPIAQFRADIGQGQVREDSYAAGELREELEGYRGHPFGVLGLPVGSYLDLIDALLDREASPDVLARAILPFVASYDTAIRQARAHRYHWERLALPLHPLEPDIMGSLMIVSAARQYREIPALDDLLGGLPLDPISQRLLAEALFSYGRWRGSTALDQR